MNQTMPPPDAATHVPPVQLQPTPSPPPAPPRPSRLFRPRDGRRIGGVCAGIADRYGWDRTLVRLLALFSIFLPGPQVIAYAVAWIVLPDETEVAATATPSAPRAGS